MRGIKYNYCLILDDEVDAKKCEKWWNNIIKCHSISKMYSREIFDNSGITYNIWVHGGRHDSVRIFPWYQDGDASKEMHCQRTPCISRLPIYNLFYYLQLLIILAACALLCYVKKWRNKKCNHYHELIDELSFAVASSLL